ncbi:MAG: preprotein translocase subunit SecG [Candidatus Magasanikbacteria bacterium RIFCSPHIGHO2_02_FULL_48_18]|nr:MAG: preprotein translocase subunit SecG [Candidatus Magasanikbacteria bacterium RIFCSPLOWO2_02_FULL_47_16]OGH79805.1 MAG: preprotein translocase subunit SecG [Candidatus Magasanikbacteria bacterium RIFCSPHIGHO2_02_FULL_48_18]
MMNILTILQIIFAILLTASILLQQRGAGLGAGFGGSGILYTTKRGADLFLYKATIVLSLLFFATAIVSLVL